MPSKIHIYVEDIKVDRWIDILIKEFQKNHIVSIGIVNSGKKEKNIEDTVIDLLFKFEQKSSSALRINLLDKIKLDEYIIAENLPIETELCINLSNQSLENCVEIKIGENLFTERNLNQSLLIPKGLPIIISAVFRNEEILASYRTSNTSNFVTGRKINLIAAISDSILYCHNATQVPRKENHFSHPTNIFRFFTLYLFNLIKTKFQAKFSTKTWHIGVTKDKQQIQMLRMPKGEFWADPFIVKDEHGYGVLFERLPKGASKGVISFKYFGQDQKSVIDILEEKHHLSFPNVLNYNGKQYLMPESKESGKIALYHLDCFTKPLDKSQTVLENIQSVDNEILYHNNKYWLFCTVKTSPLSNSGDVLKIFYSDNPMGPWTEHSQNPIKMDNSSSRGAGKIFQRNGELIRPVQNCGLGYGGSIKLMRIETLTPNDYMEICIEEILPSKFHPNATALHTINFLDNYSVVDLVINTQYANKD